MRAVVITGVFPPEMAQFERLLGSNDVVVYGSTKRRPGLTYQPHPPQSCQSRIFEPVALGRQGHLRWLYRGLFSALDADRPDIVHVVSEPWGPLALQAAAWARRRRFRGLILHGCDQKWHESRKRGDIKKWPRIGLARFSLGAAGGFAAENTAAVLQAVEGGLRAEAPTSVIHTNPRDPSTFRPPYDEVERSEARGKLGLPANGIGVGFLGRLVPEKGSGLFLEAWSLVRQRLAEGEAWAAIAGSGPLESELRRSVDATMRIQGSLRFPDEVVGFLQSIDIFVHPPRTTSWWAEQAPRALIEAMLSGCFVVASDSGANSEVIGGTGLLVPESDPHRLAEAILEAVQRVQKLPSDLAARQRALGEFSVTATAQKLNDLWQRVLDNAGMSAWPS